MILSSICKSIPQASNEHRFHREKATAAAANVCSSAPDPVSGAAHLPGEDFTSHFPQAEACTDLSGSTIYPTKPTQHICK